MAVNPRATALLVASQVGSAGPVQVLTHPVRGGAGAAQRGHRVVEAIGHDRVLDRDGVAEDGRGDEQGVGGVVQGAATRSPSWSSSTGRGW